MGNATEHTYRPALKSLLEKMTTALTVTNEPKRIACGAPDYIITRKEIPVGYIEAKDIDTDLKHKSHKTQFDRYKHSLNNLIITDYLTFQLFENENLITSVTIAKTEKNGIRADEMQFELFIGLIDRFVGYEGESILTSANLSKIMAAKARLMSKTIEEVLDEDSNSLKAEMSDDSSLIGQLKAFKDVILHEMSHKEFADIYAQTIAYGMFAARFNDQSNTPFNRTKATQLIPHSNPFLRKLFQEIVGFDVDERICWVADDMANLFNYVSIDEIKKEFDKTAHDPMIHFYETFLAEYDPALRKSRGVWYTPQPVVKFIVQAVDDILKEDFGLSEGLADTSKVKRVHDSEQKGNKEEKEYHKVQILDPATGTGTFLAEVVQNIYQRFRNNKGMWQGYANEHLISRINGFEILMASYAMAHLKLDMLLQNTGYDPSNNERLRIFLTNSLEEPRTGSGAQFAQWLGKEASEASRIKKEFPIMVVLGNPPYSGESQNKSKNNKLKNWIERLVDDYKLEPVVGSVRKLQEKNSKWINDDYVKFIRFGQYFINKNGEGILAFVTNHSFLDSPTFRGMRWNLLKTFDKIYILDLHGNAKKKETAPDGGKDENVFDIQQGVSINIFIETGQKQKNEFAKVFHSDLYGKRFDKYKFLLDSNLQTIQWRELELTAPQYFFVTKDFSLQEEYNKGFSVQEMLPVNSLGLITKRDNLSISYSEKDLVSKISFFLDDSNPIQEVCNHFGIPLKDNDKWNAAVSRTNTKVQNVKEQIENILYRPFDIRKVFYNEYFVARQNKKVLGNLQHSNYAIIIGRQGQVVGSDGGWNIVYITNSIADQNIFYRGGGTVFPLYLYPENKDQTRAYESKAPNLKPEMVKVFAEKVELQFDYEKKFPPLAGAGGGSFAPIDIFDYIYAVLHSPTYRERYKEFLKIDFPRVPYPENAAQFWKLVELGGKLRCLHLMEGVERQDGIADFNIEGNCIVEKPQYSPPLAGAGGGCVYINDTQYFDNVPLVAWNFYIGGYQPAQKWLKDRKGRVLNFDDIRHYQKMIWVLVETEEVMREVDKYVLLN